MQIYVTFYNVRVYSSTGYMKMSICLLSLLSIIRSHHFTFKYNVAVVGTFKRTSISLENGCSDATCQFIRHVIKECFIHNLS